MFLDKNALIVVDYIPGSSGRLLMRCLAEMDSAIDYHNPCIMSHQINENPASLEIDFHTIPKRYFNWYLHKQPSYDINVIFDQIGCFSVADRERSNFFPNQNYDLTREKIYYGVHSWEEQFDFSKFHQNISFVSIVPQTDIGHNYQHSRAKLCYPNHYETFKWYNDIEAFNKKQHQNIFDLCTALSTKNTEMIIEWIKSFLKSYRIDKIDKVKQILDIYYEKVVDRV